MRSDPNSQLADSPVHSGASMSRSGKALCIVEYPVLRYWVSRPSLNAEYLRTAQWPSTLSFHLLAGRDCSSDGKMCVKMVCYFCSTRFWIRRIHLGRQPRIKARPETRCELLGLGPRRSGILRWNYFLKSSAMELTSHEAKGTLRSHGARGAVVHIAWFGLQYLHVSRPKLIHTH